MQIKANNIGYLPNKGKKKHFSILQIKVNNIGYPSTKGK